MIRGRGAAPNGGFFSFCSVVAAVGKPTFYVNNETTLESAAIVRGELQNYLVLGKINLTAKTTK